LGRRRGEAWNGTWGRREVMLGTGGTPKAKKKECGNRVGKRKKMRNRSKKKFGGFEVRSRRSIVWG